MRMGSMARQLYGYLRTGAGQLEGHRTRKLDGDLGARDGHLDCHFEALTDKNSLIAERGSGRGS
jgi:hypothetical protein